MSVKYRCFSYWMWWTKWMIFLAYRNCFRQLYLKPIARALHDRYCRYCRYPKYGTSFVEFQSHHWGPPEMRQETGIVLEMMRSCETKRTHLIGSWTWWRDRPPAVTPTASPTTASGRWSPFPATAPVNTTGDFFRPNIQTSSTFQIRTISIRPSRDWIVGDSVAASSLSVFVAIDTVPAWKTQVEPVGQSIFLIFLPIHTYICRFFTK